MRLRLLAATAVIAALIGACQREPLVPGETPPGTVGGGTGIGGRAGQVSTGVGGDGVGGAVTGGGGSGGTGNGGGGIGGAGNGGAGAAGGTTSGMTDCPVPHETGQPCSPIGAHCFNVRCVTCSDQYWRYQSFGTCACDPTGVWNCGAGVGPPQPVDCFFDPPLDCTVAQFLYEDPTCQTHPACEPAN